MSPKLSSAAVVIGALWVKGKETLSQAQCVYNFFE